MRVRKRQHSRNEQRDKHREKVKCQKQHLDFTEEKSSLILLASLMIELIPLKNIPSYRFENMKYFWNGNFIRNENK